jgi:predicted RecA/RadA family phage recombinase
MKNQVAPGHTIDLVSAPYTVASGAGCLLGSAFGIAAYAANSGQPVTLWTTGVFSVAKVSAQAWTQGVLIYWDDAAKNFTSTAATNKIVGYAFAAAANPSSTGQVRLNGAALS